MKKNTLYLGLLIVFISAAGFVVIKFRGDKQQKAAATYTLLERKGNRRATEEWTEKKNAAEKLLAKLAVNAADTRSMIALANLFILEGRATGNYAYYDRAAMKYINQALATEYNNFDALTLKALILMSQHHFADGLAIATAAERVNPFSAFLYGIMVDGYVEMGHYDSAVLSAEKMMELRPDLRSYARVSFLREIHGDYPGAIEAMTLAVQAGLPGAEATEWSRVQLGHLYEQVGEPGKASLHYSIALRERPQYAHALGGLARLEAGKRNYGAALDLYRRADSLVDDLSFKEAMVDVYLLQGKEQDAAALSKTVIAALKKHAAIDALDESAGHYADKELAYAYLAMNQYDKALEHALAEYNRRPRNIEVNETLAWVYHQKGDNEKALPYLAVALGTHSRNPVLLSRAGLIYSEAGDTAKANSYLRDALSYNPNLPETLRSSVQNALAVTK